LGLFFGSRPFSFCKIANDISSTGLLCCSHGAIT
jgi:hypothetical protein